jgi:hypothetical protein
MRAIPFIQRLEMLRTGVFTAKGKDIALKAIRYEECLN